MTTISTKSSAQPDDPSQPPHSHGETGETLSAGSARHIGHELARLYREVSASLPADRPALPVVERAEAIIAASRLEDKRATDTPAPSREDLRDLARGIGYVRALKDVYSITSEIEPLFTAGARCVEALLAVGQLRSFRETIDFLRENKMSIDFEERPHPSGASQLGFLIHSDGEVSPDELGQWQGSVGHVLDVFESRTKYAPEPARQTVRVALDRLRNMHACLKTLDDVVLKHGEKVFDAEVPSMHLARASESLGKADLDKAIPRFIANNESNAGIYTALVFALREPEIRRTLESIEGEPLQHFTSRLIERRITDDNPRVAHEMKRLDDLVKRYAEPVVETSIPAEGPKNSPALTLRANLAERLSFLRESRGERFDHVLDDISRKIGPKVAIERFNLLARCCRSRSEEALDEKIVTLDPKILTLPKERFTAYLDELRVAVTMGSGIPAASLLPSTISDIVRTGTSPREAAPVAEREPRELDVVRQLDGSGLDGEMTLKILKHGFHHRGAMFTGHRTISRQGVLSLADAKIEGSRAEIEDCLDILIRRGAVTTHARGAGLALNRIADISEPALKAAVSYVETFWAERRNA